MEPLFCLRCKTVELNDLPDSRPEEIRFLECPACSRSFAKRAGKSLTFRWLHPIPVALYPVLFDRDPVARVGFVAEQLRGDHPEWRDAMIREIELELADPSHDLADSLDLVAPDALLRDYLRALAARLRPS
jgi:hypothetical protein